VYRRWRKPRGLRAARFIGGCKSSNILWLGNCCFAHDSLGLPSCYDSAMRNLIVLFIPFIATQARLLGDARSIVVQSGLPIVNRAWATIAQYLSP
jgi:hypothetical protein